MAPCGSGSCVVQAMMRSLFWKILLCGLIGGALGLMVGVGEAVWVTFVVRGTVFRPMLFLDAIVLDGGVLASAAGLLGAIWAVIDGFWRLRRSPKIRVDAGGPQVRVRVAVPARRAEVTQPRLSRRSVVRAAAMSVASVAILSVVPLTRAMSQRSPNRQHARGLFDTKGSDTGEQAPNFVLITIDTLRADHLGCYGHPFIKTPALDGLAAQGARFGMHIVQQPQTNPSHASIFSGMYPSSSGVRVHMVDKMPDRLETMATLFSRAGYSTAGLYSWLSFDPEYSNFQRGFDTYRDLATNAPAILSNPLVQQAAAEYRVARQYLTVPRLVSDVTHIDQKVENEAKGRADVTTDAAIAQLHAFQNKPFFLWVHYFDPHYPFQPPESFINMYDPDYQGPITTDIQTVYDIQLGRIKPGDRDLRHLLALYQGEISFLDSHLARFFSTMDQLGVTQNTVVAVTSDHGESFAEHADFEDKGNIFHPHSLYNVEQRTPLLLRYPRRVKPGTVIQAPTQAIDLLPTFMDLAGLPIPAQVQGATLTPLLSGTDDGAGRIAFATMPDFVFTGVTTPRYKLMQNNATGQHRLFDLVADPQESTDLSAAQPDVTSQLADRLHTWMKDVKIS